LEARVFASDRLSRVRLRALARSETAFLVVAERGRSLVGYALVLTRRGSSVARLYSLAVAPEAARGGVGSRLLAAAESFAAKHGARRLRLEVRADNAAAVSLYERRGYGPIGRREDYYEDGMAALRYERALRRAAPSSLGRAA
jgi:ribosomal protein S18 acetylase RimI-like enzyme